MRDGIDRWTGEGENVVCVWWEVLGKEEGAGWGRAGLAGGAGRGRPRLGGGGGGDLQLGLTF